MSCSMGTALHQWCSTEKPAKFLRAKNLSDRTIVLLKLRSGMTSDIKTLCKTHYRKYWKLFIPKHCCDPLDRHRVKRRRTGLWTITADFHDEFHPLCPRIVQGMKLCVCCKIQISRELDTGRPKMRSFSLDQKVVILDRLAAGWTVEGLAAELGAVEFVIQSILNKEWVIRQEVAQAEEVKAEMLTAGRELRHRVNVGGAFKMELGQPRKIYSMGHRKAIEQIGNMARQLQEGYEPKKRGRKVKTEVTVAQDDGTLEQFLVEEIKEEEEEDETVMFGECDVEVKIEIEEKPVDVGID